MTRFSIIHIGLVALMLLGTASVSAEPLGGTPQSGKGVDWQSSWLDLDPPMSFKKGERLLISVEGDAEKVLVRFLPKNSPPEYQVGIEGGIQKVPREKVLVVKLEQDRQDVKQISVHAGKKAWGIQLNGNNDPARITRIEYRPQ